MLAYRHAFHAGNHADVLKHIVWVRLLRHLNLKEKGYRVVDTHAGAGRYALGSAEAQKKGEYRDGIGRLWSRDDLPPPAADYVQLVRRLNPGGALAAYPGSPLIAAWLMRPQDELRLFERHPADHAALAGLFAPARRSPAPGRPDGPAATSGAPDRPPHRAVVRLEDGFAALKGQLPPPTRRALVLVDPSYEGRADYPRVVEAVRDALERFAQAVVMVWAPLVVKPGATPMLRDLRALARGRWLQATLTVQPPDAAGFGLLGSSVFVINPPFTLVDELRQLLPWLAAALAQFDGAGWRLEGPPATPAA